MLVWAHTLTHQMKNRKQKKNRTRLPEGGETWGIVTVRLPLLVMFSVFFFARCRLHRCSQLHFTTFFFWRIIGWVRGKKSSRKYRTRAQPLPIFLSSTFVFYEQWQQKQKIKTYQSHARLKWHFSFGLLVLPLDLMVFFSCFVLFLCCCEMKVGHHVYHHQEKTVHGSVLFFSSFTAKNQIYHWKKQMWTRLAARRMPPEEVIAWLWYMCTYYLFSSFLIFFFRLLYFVLKSGDSEEDSWVYRTFPFCLLRAHAFVCIHTFRCLFGGKV